MHNLIKEKQLIAITPEECLGQTIGCMSEVSSVRRCNNYSEHSYVVLILIFTYTKKVGTGHYSPSQGPPDQLWLASN